MPLTASDKRFLKYWEEQREGGRKIFVVIYSVGLTVLVFLSAVALGLFMNLPFIKFDILGIVAISSVVSAIALSFFIWHRQEKKYQRLLDQFKSESN